jgi:Spx/MgsR family transcriptional regulator
MEMLELYGLKNCSTCAKATKWLGEHGVEHRFIDYRDHPVSPEALRTWAAKLGGWEKLVNRASMTWRNLTDAQKGAASDDDWLALIALFPALVRRPVTIDLDGGVSVGFSEKKFSERYARP